MDSKCSPRTVWVERKSWWGGSVRGASLGLGVLLIASDGTGMAAGTKSGGRPSAARAVGVSGDWGHGWGRRPVLL